MAVGHRVSGSEVSHAAHIGDRLAGRWSSKVLSSPTGAGIAASIASNPTSSANTNQVLNDGMFSHGVAVSCVLKAVMGLPVRVRSG